MSASVLGPAVTDLLLADGLPVATAEMLVAAGFPATSELVPLTARISTEPAARDAEVAAVGTVLAAGLPTGAVFELLYNRELVAAAEALNAGVSASALLVVIGDDDPVMALVRMLDAGLPAEAVSRICQRHYGMGIGDAALLAERRTLPLDVLVEVIADGATFELVGVLKDLGCDAADIAWFAHSRLNLDLGGLDDFPGALADASPLVRRLALAVAQVAVMRIDEALPIARAAALQSWAPTFLTLLVDADELDPPYLAALQARALEDDAVLPGPRLQVRDWARPPGVPLTSAYARMEVVLPESVAALAFESTARYDTATGLYLAGVPEADIPAVLDQVGALVDPLVLSATRLLDQVSPWRPTVFEWAAAVHAAGISFDTVRALAAHPSVGTLPAAMALAVCGVDEPTFERWASVGADLACAATLHALGYSEPAAVRAATRKDADQVLILASSGVGEDEVDAFLEVTAGMAEVLARRWPGPMPVPVDVLRILDRLDLTIFEVTRFGMPLAFTDPQVPVLMIESGLKILVRVLPQFDRAHAAGFARGFDADWALLLAAVAAGYPGMQEAIDAVPERSGADGARLVVDAFLAQSAAPSRTRTIARPPVTPPGSSREVPR